MNVPKAERLRPADRACLVAAIDDPSRIRRSRDIGAYLGLVPRRYQSGEVDYTGGISKCGDRWVRTLLYEAANVMLTRYKGQLKLKDWAVAIARRSTMRKARIALARRPAIIMHAMLRTSPRRRPPRARIVGRQSGPPSRRDDASYCAHLRSRGLFWPPPALVSHQRGGIIPSLAASRSG